MGLSGNGQSCVPPGFRFHPTDEELLYYYLKKKVSYEMIDLNVIRDVDLNKLEPWDLHERCKIGSAPQNEWYFFSHKDKKYPTGTRTNRATAAGFWKATGRDKPIYMNFKRIGMRKTLVFYTGRAPHGQKTEWIMHEYRLEDSENPQGNEDGWVVCRVFKKRMHLKGSSSAEPDRPSGSTNEEEQQQALNFPLMVDSNHSNSVGEVIHNLQSSNHEYSHHQQLNINMERHQLQQQEPQQFTNFSHEIFPQMPQLHSPDTAVIKNFIPDSLLDMNISRRSLPIDMNLQTGLAHNTTTTTSNNNIKFMQQQQHAAAADFSREDHQRRSGTADWTMLDRLIDPNNNLSHEPQQHQTQDHSKHHDQTHHHQSHTTPHSLDLCSNQGSLLRSYHNPHQPENTDFAPAHGIEYWNFAK